MQVGLYKFLPKSVINTNKPKPLRKLIQQHFRKYAVLGDLECMFKFFEILKSVYRFDQERYQCTLGSPSPSPSPGTGVPWGPAGPFLSSWSLGLTRGFPT